MSYIELNDLGSFASIEDVWAAYPEGGQEGDYCTIDGTKYHWNKYTRMWGDTEPTPTPSRPVVTFDGDVNIQNDLTVAGYIRAKGIKQPCLGLFLSEDSLTAKWPDPEVGMWALVGDEFPATVYVCETEGEWTETQATGGPDDVDLTNYVTVSEHESDIATLVPKSDIADNTNTNNAAKVLSARQGYLMNQRLESIETYELGSSTYDESDLIAGKMYITSVNVGETITGELHAGASACMKLTTVKGDKVVVASKGGINGRAYCVTDRNNVVIAVAASKEDTTSDPVELIASVDGYVYINSVDDEEALEAFAVTHYYSEERRLIEELGDDMEDMETELRHEIAGMSPERAEGIIVVTDTLIKSSTATRYLRLPYTPNVGKRYTLTLTSPSAIAEDVVITANIGASGTGSVEIATIEGGMAAETPVSVDVEFPDNQRTYIFSQSFLNLDITGTISVRKVMIDEGNIKGDSALMEKMNAITTKIVTGNLVQRSVNSTYLTLPFKTYKDKTYTVTLTSDTNITAPVVVTSNLTNSSTGQVEFATLTEDIVAGVPFTFSGKFPDNDRIYIRSTSFTGGSSSDITVSGTISVNAEDIKAEDLSEDLIEQLGSSDKIIPLNRDAKNILNDVALKRANGTNLNVLTVAHITDTHGNDANVERYNEWCAKYADIIDQKINTGDVMETAYNLGSFDDSLFTKTLIAIGNHDTANYNGSIDDWTAHQGIDAFEKYIEPLYEGWGVTLAADAAEEGYCYYYKDFASKNIRLIVLDAMDGQSDGQVEWLESRLTEAKTAGYSVIIAYHYIPSKNVIYFNCPFTSEFPVEGDANHATMVATVADFQADGGKFIAWMVGHVHRDYSGYIQTTSGSTTVKQVVLCVATGSNGASNQDMARVEGEKSQDLFNVYGFDTTTKVIKVMRVGADYDLWGRHKNTMCINYETAELLEDKQDRLVSGTNIKTINNQSLLGSGNITIQGGGGSAVQSDWNQSDSTADDYIKNKPSLATVATSGSYDDLDDKPTIPAAQVQSNWNESDTSSKAYIQNKPTIPAAQVNADWNASSGVAQILNKPTIPTVPTNVSAFNNDAGYLNNNFCPIIEDTRSSAVAAITGVAPFASLETGQKILLHLAYNTVSSATLNLTLSDGTTTTGAKTMKIAYNTSFVNVGTGYTYIAGCYIPLIYDGTNWRVAGRENDTTYSSMTQANINSGTATTNTVSAKLIHDNAYIVEESYSSGSLKANKFYDFGTVSSALTIPSLDATNDLVSNALNFYALRFIAGADNLNITFPTGVIVDDEPTINTGDYVEIMINLYVVNGVNNFYASIKVWQAQQ